MAIVFGTLQSAFEDADAFHLLLDRGTPEPFEVTIGKSRTTRAPEILDAPSGATVRVVTDRNDRLSSVTIGKTDVLQPQPR